jgi:hypothetical protein
MVIRSRGQALGRFGEVNWRALLIAHAVADVFPAIGITRVHLSLRQAFQRAYQELGWPSSAGEGTWCRFPQSRASGR